ncbi:MAG: hypothetical protein EA413_06970 [Cyanobium sp. PLM2.Bin73]|nr:MAG: hypothetical protein EA413_06970 [Cyanobium sp. PLM2.Bin73]
MQGIQESGRALHLFQPAAFLTRDAHPKQRPAALEGLQMAMGGQLRGAERELAQGPIHGCRKSAHRRLVGPSVEQEPQLQEIATLVLTEGIELLQAVTLVGHAKAKGGAEVDKGFIRLGIQGIAGTQLARLQHRLQA